MEIIPMLLKEMEEEAQTTRKMLERVPNDKFDWRPHPKSMNIRSLATHIAELPGMGKHGYRYLRAGFCRCTIHPNRNQ